MRSRYLLLTLAALPAPALADHVGPGGVGGGTLTLISPDTLPAGHAAVGLRLTYNEPEDRSDAELAALAGKHIHAHNADFTLNGSVGAAFGVSDDLTVSIELPYVRRDGLREGTHVHSGGQAVNGVETLGTVAGLGDASLLARYRLPVARGAAFAVIGGLKLPTGSTHRVSDGGERLETEHQPGTGSWDPIVGAAFGAGNGPVRVTMSALYQFSGGGAQRTRLGDRAQGGVALSHRFGPAEHHHDDHEDHPHGEGAAEHHHDREHPSWDAFVELAGEWEGRQRVAGETEEASGGSSIWLTPGTRFNSAKGFSLGLGLGVPLWQHIRESHPDNRYRLILSLGKAF